MKYFLGAIFLILQLNGHEIDGYGTVGVVSSHFTTDENGNSFNQKHDAYGAEIVWDSHYTLGYLHFTNSRNKATDIVALGYRYDLYGPFGFYAAAGYQRGYCFDGLKSIECRAGADDSGVVAIPMFYYRHKYFTLDLIPYTDMVALKLNLKLF